MASSATGTLHGNTITLDRDLPALEGERVRVVLEPLGRDDSASDPEEQRRLWAEWLDHGDQGPIGDEGEPEFP